MYVGPRRGTFTLTGKTTGIDYGIIPGMLVPIHPSDALQFERKAKGKKKEYKIVW